MREPRSIVALLRYVASWLFGLSMIVMVYGIYYFPAAPIRYVDGQYIDKRGQTHSREEFEHLHTWERVYFVSWTAAAAAAVAFQVAKRGADGR